MNITIITTTKKAAHVDVEDIITMTMNTIIMITKEVVHADAEDITTTTMNTIIITTMEKAVHVDVAGIITTTMNTIITIMLMKYLQAGEKKQHTNIRKKNFMQLCMHLLTAMNLVQYFVQKELLPWQMVHGSNLILFQKNMKCVKEKRIMQAAFA